MTKQQLAKTASGRELFDQTQQIFDNMPSLEKGGEALGAAVISLEPFGFKTKRNVKKIKNTFVILCEMGTFIDGLIAEVPRKLPKHMSAKAAKRIAEQIQKPFEAVQAFRSAIERVMRAFDYRIEKKEFFFRAAGPKNRPTQQDYIRMRLKDFPKEAEAFIIMLRNLGVDVYERAPTVNEGIIRTDSNRKSPDEQDCFYKHGLVDSKQGINIVIAAILEARRKNINLRTIHNIVYHEGLQTKCERVYKEARKAGISKGTANMLKMLTHGEIRVEVKENDSRMIALNVNANGRLWAGDFNGHDRAHGWAMGRVPLRRNRKSVVGHRNFDYSQFFDS